MKQPATYIPCACGCGKMVRQKKFGRPRRYFNSQCRWRVWDRAHPRAELERSQASQGAGQLPPLAGMD